MVPLPYPAGRQCHLLVLLFLFFPGLTCALLGQIYKPSDPFTMWDTWLYQDENTDHLFFLQSEPELIWNTIGQAVSTDLLDWQQLPAISASVFNEAKKLPAFWEILNYHLA